VNDSVKVVCFDIGGVLARITLDIEQASRVAGVSPILDKGLFSDYPFYLEYQRGALDCNTYLESFSSVLGRDVADALAIHNGLVVGPYPGTWELVRELNSKGVTTACLSNTNALHWEYMTTGAIPALAELRYLLASHVIGLEKPNLAFYRHFETVVEVTPADVVFFDDVEANVLGAREAGWRSELIDPLGDPARQIRGHLGLP
jgi:putative hydrolase of the HAD superfamily